MPVILEALNQVFTLQSCCQYEALLMLTAVKGGALHFIQRYWWFLGGSRSDAVHKLSAQVQIKRNASNKTI